MVARLQRLTVFLLIALSLLTAAYSASNGYTYLGGLAAMLILLGYVFVLGVEFLILSFVHGSGSNIVTRPHVAQLLRAWWAEVLNFPKVFFWRQPFRSKSHPDNLADGIEGQAGVVLVHGFGCNRGLWNPWMHLLQDRRARFIAVNLEPVFGSIDEYTQIIEFAVAQMEATTSMPVLLVGHSMGGLAIRAWMSRFNADSRVRRVITIGSPHRGTWVARCGHTKNIRQMRVGSVWLADLAAHETAARRKQFTCFFGHCDNIVFPAITATLPDADNRHIPGTAHVHMAFQNVVFNEVVRWLDTDSMRAAASRAPSAPAR